jgi:chaperonin cofactor prefoldin
VQKEKEDLDDVSNELELADEDDKVPYVANITQAICRPAY